MPRIVRMGGVGLWGEKVISIRVSMMRMTRRTRKDETGGAGVLGWWDPPSAGSSASEVGRAMTSGLQ